jgi:hypothetical protein
MERVVAKRVLDTGAPRCNLEPPRSGGVARSERTPKGVLKHYRLLVADARTRQRGRNDGSALS